MKERGSGQPTSKDALLELKQKGLSALRKGLNASFRLGGAATLFLTACAEARPTGNGQTPISEPVPATSTIDMTPPPTDESLRPAVAVDSPTPEVTPTVDIESLPMSEVARLLAEGQISYPEHWNNEQRKEFGIAMAEYVNNEVAGDKAYVEMSFPEIGDTKIAFTTDYGGFWRSSHNTPEDKLDLTGENLPPMFVAGYTNTEGQEVFINEQGQEVIVPKINFPGLGEISITELYAMGVNNLKNYAIDTMLGADGVNDHAKQVIEGRRNTQFALPVVLYENAAQNEKIYAFQQPALGGPEDQIPEANATFMSWPTNNVLMPVLEPASKQLIGWVSIQQGLRFIGMDSFTFQSEENPKFYFSAATADPNTFGYDASDSVAISLMGKTTDNDYSHPSVTYFLERSDYIGSAAEIQQLMNVKNVPEIMRVFDNLRLFVSYPTSYIYPTQ